VARLKEERDDRLLRAQHGIPEVHGRVRRDLVAWYTSEVDSALDQHVGASWLRDRRVAELVERAIRFFQGDRYALHAWCVMPNHVHVVVQPLESYALDSILHSWKSFTAHAANKLLARPGRAFWQQESYDHWIRDGRDLTHCCHYTENNPVKAGLCDRAEDWPWSSAARK
jgi:REP element-mobilizing transposase RayT